MWFEAKSAGGKVFRVNVKESGVRFNYSQMTHTFGQSGYYWDTMQGHTEKFYTGFGTNYNWICPVAAVEALIRFPIGDNNCITMSANPDEQFYGTSGTADAGNGAVMSTSEGSNFLLSFFTVTQDSTSYAYCGGIFRVNPYGYSGQTQAGFNSYPSSDRFVYETDESKIPAMSFWLLTMHDDVQSSTTYGQDFDVIMVAVRGGVYGGGESHPNTFCLFDARMFKGASNLTPTKSTTRGNSPTGWTGSRNDKSDSDTESHIGSALRMANTTTYGLHFYRLQQQHLEWFQECLWGNDFWDNARMSQWNPIRGIISLHNLPVSLTVGNETTITVCGKKCQTSTMHHGTTNCLAFPVNDDKWEGSSSVFYPLEYSGSFLDWSTYTRAKLRLPFIGVVPIDVNLIMQGGGIYVKYNIDCITGNCLAQIYVKPQLMGDEGDGTCLMMIAQYSGNCAYKHTISTSDFGGGTALGSIISGVANVGIAAIAAFSGHPAAAGAAGIGAVKNLLSSKVSSQYSNEVQQATPNVDCMGMLVTALILERPIDITPLDENGDATVRKYFDGIPAASGGKVRDYKTGINQEVFIQGKIHADTLYATEREKKEIEDAFAKGVYI